ncbi:phosphoglucosamine mutase [Termitidicoccus mucosus]|uniref:Phosphoglucosamine mutase n=1 Tax=Termitidicoccus mucosus TaxID=1184151 RepID=A0A178IF80_9BACT|nr:phosphoglucosamine mutase [Opitutaceae bacterium TSB47]
MKRTYFGTDGVRGPYGGPVINEQFAARLGEAAAHFAMARAGRPGNPARVLIGRDTRGSGWRLEQAVAAGLAAGGLSPAALGIVPTPAVAAAVLRERAILGVMITASHNPAGDNGIKFFDHQGLKFNDAGEAEIESLLPGEARGRELAAGIDSAAATHAGPLPRIDGLAAYLETTRSLLPPGALAGWRVALDTANGSTCATSPMVLRGFGATVDALGAEPDGKNINAGVGSEHPGKLAARVRETGAQIGIAHDGDGDRCILCDEHGAVLDGDEILTLLALHALNRRSLAADTLVVTVQSNLGVDAAVRAAGGRVERSAVGDRYVIEKMLATGATLGGESSGHVIFSDISRTGDGLVAALKVLEVMLETGRPLSELRKGLKKFPQATSSLRVREKLPLDALPPLSGEIAALERELGAEGRVLVRYSGTETKLRLLVEGPTAAAVKSGLARLDTAARQALEVV